ncbi:MAG: T9SS type A sorting domain-containing protein [Bacteroidetes bacterium]|nr:T9SS type A sorting domain-containing protein [Bacteroidota bacterium]MCW5896107.1 T9SS type A sorting domain-containing protein [Bacteroidota bacterium]
MKHIFGFLAIAMCLLVAGTSAFAQTLYRSNANGNWSSTGTWQVSTNNGSTWGAAASTPTNANNAGITIRSPHTVTVTSSVTVDQVVIESGGQVTINNGNTLTINDGTGTDLSVFGTLQTNSTSNTSGITNNGTIVFNDGGTYIHNVAGEGIPTAAWDANSTCIITGATGGFPSGLGQTFGNFTWNCASQSNNLNLEGSIGGIAGNFTVSNTGGQELRLANTSTERTLTVGGNYIQTGGTFILVDNDGSGTLDVVGNFTLSGGTFIGVNDPGPAELIVGGNFAMSGGTFTLKSNNSGSAVMSVSGDFSKTGGTFNQRGNALGTSTVTIGGNFTLSTAGTYLMTSNGASTLNIGGGFSLSAGATFNMSSSGTGSHIGTMNVAGNFSFTGGAFTETGSASGAVIFNGSTPQVFTGGGTFANTINFTVNGGASLMMGNSDFGIGSNGTFTLTAGSTLGIGHPSGIAISGTASNVRVTGSRTYPSTANYIFTGDASQVPGPGLPLTMNHLTFRNPSGTTFPDLSTYIINGNLSIDAGGAFVAGDGSTFQLKGNWIKNPAGIFNPGTSKFILNGTSPQTMSGSTFYDLEINNAAGVTLLTDETVSNILTLTNGVVTTGAHKIVVTNTAPGAVSITSGSISGTIQRTASIAGIYRFTNFHTYLLLNGSQTGKQITMTSFPGVFPEPIANQSAAIKRYYFIDAPSNLFADSLYLAFIDGIGNENPNNIPGLDVAVFRLRPGTTSWENYGPFGGTSNRAVGGHVANWGTKFAIGNGLQALPVQLASFTGAVVAGNNVRLDWRTISEVNNYGFYVQRRNMGATEWTEIPGSFVPGHGTTNEPRDYTYTDITGITSATQYRLKQVDLDGTQHYTEPILVDMPTSVPEVAPKVFALSQNYPNPFNPSTEIKFTVEVTGRATLDVYNSIGQKVATLFDGIAEAGQFNLVRFNATGLASGVYFYRLQSGQKSDLKKLMLLK